MKICNAKNNYFSLVLLILSAIQFICLSCYGMKSQDRTMPSAEILKQRLIKYPHLLTYTDLIAQIADKKLHECNVVWALDTALYDYKIYLQKQKWPKGEIELAYEQLNKQRPWILRLLLQDFPDVIENIKKKAVFKTTQ